MSSRPFSSRPHYSSNARPRPRRYHSPRQQQQTNNGNPAGCHHHPPPPPPPPHHQHPEYSTPSSHNSHHLLNRPEQHFRHQHEPTIQQQQHHTRGYHNQSDESSSRRGNASGGRGSGGQYNHDQGPLEQMQRSRTNRRGGRNQSKKAPKESALSREKQLASQYEQSLANVSVEQIRQLDVFPYQIEDLLQPGKGIGHLHMIMTVAENHYKAKPIKFEATPLLGEWYGILTIYHPEEKNFICKHKNKKECKNTCALAAVHYLRIKSVIDADLKLCVKASEFGFNEDIRGPVQVPVIPMAIKQQMMSFISKYDECVADLLEYRIESSKKHYTTFDSGVEGKHTAILEGLELDESSFNEPNDQAKPGQSKLPDEGIVDIFNSRLYSNPDASKKAHCFEKLKNVYQDKELLAGQDSNYITLMQNQAKLPIRSYSLDIVQALQSHRAIVVAGDTGCGKSTQVPQFLMEEFIKNDNSNSFINIAITQPRRISAIALAERVSQELGEPSTGYTVGHNVRFDSKMPRRDLNIMAFFTTGMLLKKLQRNSDLKGVSHLIVDEVHERDCTTDFLLILVKRLLERRRDLRVVFMSASMDANLFAKYFDNCPVVTVPGRCHPVADVFLEDMRADLNREYAVHSPKLNINLLVWLIEHIDKTRKPGAILCFMPGWKEMSSLHEKLKHSLCKLKIVMTHSKLPIHEQRLIFSRPGPGERKVILATNIAETSITINDVCYVIDTGLCNSIDYDPELNMSTFGTRWISRANAKQRSGRAGRTAPGECFKLYTRKEASQFQDYPFPELLRIPLESVIMDAKCHCPQEKAVDFLSQAIQHPSISAIHGALDELTFLGVLDNYENLTVLGRRISNFTTHPRLSVALVLATAMKSLYPILNASAMLSSTQDPFILSLTEKRQIREVKTSLCNEVIGTGSDPANFMSDHVAVANLLAQYDNASTSKSEQDYFIRKNCLNPNAMLNIQTCRNYHAKMMIASKLTNSFEWYSFDSMPNRNMNELELFIGCVTHAFYPKIIRLVKGTIKNNRLHPGKVSPTDVLTNKKIRFVSDSVVRNISVGKALDRVIDDSDSEDECDYTSLNSQSVNKPNFITYMNSRADQESNLIVIRDGTVVPPLVLALFGGRDIAITESSQNSKSRAPYGTTNDDGFVTIILDRQSLLSFKTSRDDAYVLRDWRNVWQRYFEWFVHTKDSSQSIDANDSIIAQTMNDFLELTKKLFASTA